MTAGCTDGVSTGSWAKQMTGIDLIVAAPWIVFGAGLATVCFLLLRSHRASWHRPGRSSRPSSDPAGAESRPRRASAGQETISCPNPQEAKCPEKKWQTRPH
jgi:hypothetical protein